MKFERDTSHPQFSGTPLLFLPGWGFDARFIRLFRLLSGENLILPETFLDPRTFVVDLCRFLEDYNIERIRVVGWSMGANLALEFTQMHPDYVVSVDLYAMRGRWPAEEIDAIKRGVAVDLPGYMVGFYRKCFLGYKKYHKEFVRLLQDDYLANLNEDILFAGLKYLENYNSPKRLPDLVKITLVHGNKDVVAPVGEMMRLSGARVDIVRSSGHMVLLDRLLPQ